MSDSQQVPSEIGTEDGAVNEHRDKKVNTDTIIQFCILLYRRITDTYIYIMTYTQLFSLFFLLKKDKHIVTI